MIIIFNHPIAGVDEVGRGTLAGPVVAAAVILDYKNIPNGIKDSKKFTKKISNAQKFRKLCESKINKPISGFKAAGTGIPVLKKLNEKEPFYAAVYKHNVLKNKESVKINKFTMGIELEVCYLN